ncbi:hypothetical protein LINGRAHAP2_LOCUS18170 [Linum grandiflorum]
MNAFRHSVLSVELVYKEQQCELRYCFPEDQLSFVWDDSIKVVSRQEARARAANPWLRVRERTAQGIPLGAVVQGRGRGLAYPPAIPSNICELVVCMRANAWDKDKWLDHPHMSSHAAIKLNMDDKKMHRMEDNEVELMDIEDNTRQPPAKMSPNKQH